MNTLSDLMQPSINAVIDWIDNWRIEFRLKSIQREKQVLERQIANDMAAIAKLTKEEINLRNQFFLPKGLSL